MLLAPPIPLLSPLNPPSLPNETNSILTYIQRTWSHLHATLQEWRDGNSLVYVGMVVMVAGPEETAATVIVSHPLSISVAVLVHSHLMQRGVAGTGYPFEPLTNVVQGAICDVCVCVCVCMRVCYLRGGPLYSSTHTKN